MRHLLLALIAFLQMPQIGPAAKQTGQPPATLQFSILGVAIGEDNLETLQKKLGPTAKCRNGEHAYMAGYTNSREDLIFEVGGGDITGFYIRPAQRSPRCSLSPLSSGSPQFTTQGGVHLGLTRTEFVHIFGLPLDQTKRASWNYKWSWQVKSSGGDKKAIASETPGYAVPDTADISVLVQAKFDGDSLRYFGIWKLETS